MIGDQSSIAEFFNFCSSSTVQKAQRYCPAKKFFGMSVSTEKFVQMMQPLPFTPNPVHYLRWLLLSSFFSAIGADFELLSVGSITILQKIWEKLANNRGFLIGLAYHNKESWYLIEKKVVKLEIIHSVEKWPTKHYKLEKFDAIKNLRVFEAVKFRLDGKSSSEFRKCDAIPSEGITSSIKTD